MSEHFSCDSGTSNARSQSLWGVCAYAAAGVAWVTRVVVTTPADLSGKK